MTVRFVLLGYPVRGDLAIDVRAYLAREGVDLGSYPTPTADEVAAWRAKRQPPCNGCARLRAEMEALRAELATERETAPPAPTPATATPPKPPAPGLAVVRTPAPRRPVVTIEMTPEATPGEADSATG